ncbi:MAG: NADH-quinone oxidoreductase subunit E [Anaerolineaceae bacterium]|nr:NADH-quinone oxidoreductase subunit E [Anaerolineaceae bacterium]
MVKFDLKPLSDSLLDFIPEGRSALLPALHAAQQLYGYIPEEAAHLIADSLKVPLADIYGVIDFYTLFFREPVGETVIHVCNDPACALAGSDTIMKVVNQKYMFNDSVENFRPQITIERAPCLGLCESAPAMLVQGKPAIGKNITNWEELITGGGSPPQPIVSGDIEFLTANCKNEHVTNLEVYVQGGGYSSLQYALSIPPAEIINQVKSSGLVGRGGAAFPTGVKWEGAARETDETKYVVCNGDEAEPGTFKDRILLEKDPHRILEGMIISAYAIGAKKGYFYIRGEYLIAYERIIQAIDDAKSANYLGKNILGTEFSFEIEVRRGAGAYICGEETALFESIEGKRGFPRVKPPFPTVSGLFGKPTVINNVETLANIPLILSIGVEAYRSIGTEKSPGPKLFCVSGDVQRPGLYEVPFGVSLHHLILDLAGGMKEGSTFHAALIGGAAGAFAGEDHLNVMLSFEDLRSHGLPLGSGVITVFDESRDMIDICHRLAHFFADESCGKCYPCQIGTKRQYEILSRINQNRIDPEDQQRLIDLAETMTDTSLCGLGQTAGSAIVSAMKLWPHLFKPQTVV